MPISANSKDAISCEHGVPVLQDCLNPVPQKPEVVKLSVDVFAPQSPSVWKRVYQARFPQCLLVVVKTIAGPAIIEDSNPVSEAVTRDHSIRSDVFLHTKNTQNRL